MNFQEIAMGIPKGPTEGGSGGNRGHSNMEHWGYTGEVKETARKRRRIEDKQIIQVEKVGLGHFNDGHN